MTRYGAVQRVRSVVDASVRIFLFHHAGGSHLLYQGWGSEFPADWEICAVDAPGRGRLRGIPLMDACDDLVGFLHDELEGWMDRPFAFFGHSMGAMVVYELTRRLTALGHQAPVWAGLSSCGVRRPADSSARPRSLLTDAELRDWLQWAGGTPRELLDDEALWKMFGPVFRADFALAEAWTLATSVEPVDVPITAFGSVDDKVVTVDQLLAWRSCTRHFLGLHAYEGGHFYLRRHRRAVARRIVESVFNGLRQPYHGASCHAKGV